ncbi:ATPase [Calidifontibacillus erzurumensis]|nr:ATPase [Calidifontibacillus erzurumensis]
MVIATDCSGGIGEKANDILFVADNVVAYFAMRVAMMELLSVGATPSAVILSNFTGEKSWQAYMSGIQKVYEELGMNPLPLVGSTETNMMLQQSALGLTVLGTVLKNKKRIKKTPKNAAFAVIGVPLAGEKVLTEQALVAPLSLFKKCLDTPGVFEIVPVGSKGIFYEFQLMLTMNGFDRYNVDCSLPLNESSGPATCFLISYNRTFEQELQALCGRHFHKINIEY